MTHLRLIALAFVLVACGSPPPPATVEVPPAAEPKVEAVDLPSDGERPPALETVRNRVDGPVEIAFVIDRSGSMTGLPMEMAKKATLKAIRQLMHTDRVTVISFDSVAETVAASQPADAKTLIESVWSIEPGGGTEILSSLEVAHDALSNAKMAARQVILLTDGKAPYGGIRERVLAMRKDGIIVTTVGLGNSFDAKLLQMMAELGDGRYYAVADPADLPDVMTEEVSIAIAKK